MDAIEASRPAADLSRTSPQVRLGRTDPKRLMSVTAILRQQFLRASNKTWNRDEAVGHRILLSLTGSLAWRRIGALSHLPCKVLSRSVLSSLSAF